MEKRRVVIWGAGEVGRDVVHNILNGGAGNKDKEIITVVDSNPALTGRKFFGFEIILPKDILSFEFDTILVCTSSLGAKMGILYRLLEFGIDKEKINLFPQVLLAKSDNPGFGSERLDYVKKLMMLLPLGKGHIAECGVNQGDFACRLNTLFYDRKLYLFDTFEGFDERDLTIENNISTVSGIRIKDCNENGYFKTSTELVMSKMPYKDNVIFKKGWVPDTFAGIDDAFAFVSLDMDLYAPTLAALRFFYPKIQGGGVILLHDYYHASLPGVKKAVDEFENEIGFLIKAPSFDYCSLAVIKP